VLGFVWVIEYALLPTSFSCHRSFIGVIHFCILITLIRNVTYSPALSRSDLSCVLRANPGRTSTAAPAHGLFNLSIFFYMQNLTLS